MLKIALAAGLCGVVLAVSAAPIRSASMPAPRRLPVLAMNNIGQAIDTFFGDDDHASTMPAIATVRASLGNVPLAPKAHATVTAAAGDDVNGDSIHEHRNSDRAKNEAD